MGKNRVTILFASLKPLTTSKILVPIVSLLHPPQNNNNNIPGVVLEYKLRSFIQPQHPVTGMSRPLQGVCFNWRVYCKGSWLVLVWDPVTGGLLFGGGGRGHSAAK
jgi:hypothetical protein